MADDTLRITCDMAIDAALSNIDRFKKSIASIADIKINTPDIFTQQELTAHENRLKASVDRMNQIISKLKPFPSAGSIPVDRPESGYQPGMASYRVAVASGFRRMNEIPSNAGYNNAFSGIAGSVQTASGIQSTNNALQIMAQNAFAAQNANKKLSDSIVSVGEVSVGASVGFGQMFAALGLSQLAVDALYKAFDLLSFGILKSIKIVDQMRLSAASMAGAMLISDPSMGIDQALGNSKKLIEASFQMSKTFVGNARELQLLTEAAVTFGLKLDFTTQKSRDEFVAFANTLKLITQGQNFEIQAFQEIRAVMQGQNFQGAMLARRLQAVGIDVAKMVPQWVAQGTVIENIVKALGGYAAASEAIRQTWEAQYKYTVSIASLILARGTDKAYDKLRDRLMEINDLYMDGNGLTQRGLDIVTKIEKAWTFIFDLVTGYVKVLSDLAAGYAKIHASIEAIMMIVSGKAALNLLTNILGLDSDNLQKGKEWVDELFAHILKAGIALSVGLAASKIHWTVGIAAALITAAGFTAVEVGKQQREEKAAAEAKLEGMAGGGWEVWNERYTATSPSGKVRPEKEWEAWIRNTKNFLANADLEIQTYIGNSSNKLASSIAKAKLKVQKEYEKFFVFDEQGKVTENKPEFERLLSGTSEETRLANKIKEKMGEQTRAAVQAETDRDAEHWRKATRKLAEDAEKESLHYAKLVGSSTREVSDAYNVAAEEYEDGADKLNSKIAKATAEVHKKIEDERQKLSAPSELGGGYNADFDAIEAFWKRVLDMKIKNLNKWDDIRKEKDKIQLESMIVQTKAWEDEAKIPTIMPWNEREVGSMLAMTNALEDYNNKLKAFKKQAEELESRGMMSPDDKRGGERALLDRYKKIVEGIKVQFSRLDDMIKGIYLSMEASFSEFFTDVWKQNLHGADAYFRSFAEGIAATWAKLMAQMVAEWLMAKALTGGKALLGLLGVGEGGWTPENSGTFAKGGVVDGATVFKFARGVGVMGEAGPEGILPLKRTSSGALGVQVAGGGGGKGAVSVQIINESGQKMAVTKSTAKFDGQGMIVTAWLDAYNRNSYGLRTAMGR
jgi:hypothetical protein